MAAKTVVVVAVAVAAGKSTRAVGAAADVAVGAAAAEGGGVTPAGFAILVGISGRISMLLIGREFHLPSLLQ